MNDTSEDHRPVRKGWLLKKARRFGFSRRVFCSITGKGMSFASKEKSRRQRWIPIDSGTRVEMDKDRQFVVTGKDGKGYKFAVAVEDDLSAWVTALRSVAACAKDMSMNAFDVMSVIGRGAYGRVLLCKKHSTGELFAIKALDKSALSSPAKVQALFTERAVLIRMNHPFIAHLSFAFQSGTKIYLGMPYFPGGDLDRRLRSGYIFGKEEIRLIAAQIALGLKELHQNKILYRDMKPENILTDENGYVRLADFGLAEICTTRTPESSVKCGTLEYLAPEMIEIDQYGEGVDWWALGVVLYELATKVTPFRRSTQYQTCDAILRSDPVFEPTMDPDLVELIRGLLEKDPSKRLGADGVLTGKFVKGIDLYALARREIRMPYRPVMVNGVGDLNLVPIEGTNNSRVSSEEISGSALLGFSWMG